MSIVKRFVSEEENQTLWTSDFTTPAGDERTVFSGAVETTDKVMDYDTGFSRNERRIAWIKTTDSEKDLDGTIDMVIKDIKAKKIAIARLFVDEPLYDTHLEDINPSTGEKLGRWSYNKLVPTSKFAELDKSQMDETLKARLMKTEATAPPAEVQAEAVEGVTLDE